MKKKINLLEKKFYLFTLHEIYFKKRNEKIIFKRQKKTKSSRTTILF